jgi:DNA-binding transcriptional ArsR family regulator
MKIKCVKCFKTVSINSRFKIFEFLKKNKKEVSVSDLVNLTALKQPTVTFHLNKLAQSGLIKKRKAGRMVYCKAIANCPTCPLN